jgi:hypothetical protein
MTEEEWLSSMHPEVLVKLGHVQLAVLKVAKICDLPGWSFIWLQLAKALESPNAHASARDAAWCCQRIISETVESAFSTASLQCALLRDIFGNPFRPIAFSPEWRTSTAVAIAQGMYDSRDFSPMPLLADALQDAGCEVPEIIDHCRGPGPHVRGSWVVDGVLGK